jgi:hypothetical protein
MGFIRFELKTRNKTRGHGYQKKKIKKKKIKKKRKNKLYIMAGIQQQFNPFTANSENAMSLSVPGIRAPCEKFPQSVN